MTDRNDPYRVLEEIGHVKFEQLVKNLFLSFGFSFIDTCYVSVP